MKYKFRYIFVILVLFPSMSSAASGENMEYIGYLESGKKISIGYKSGPEEDKDWVWFFGIKGDPLFGTCWVSDGESNNYFKCSKKYKGNSTVQYEYISQENKKYKSAIETYNKYENCKDGVMSIFICKENCTKNTPVFIFEVGHDGDCGEL